MSDLYAAAGDPSVVAWVFDQMPNMVVATEGPEHRIVAATGAYRAYTDRPQMIGATMAEMFAEVMGQQPVKLFDEVYASGRPLVRRDWRAQMNLPNAGGTVEFFADVKVHPRTGPDGRTVGVTVDLTDVTDRVLERRAAQQRAAEAERRYEQARELIDTLQRELLPAGVPVLPRVQIAASYLLADTDTAAGGDWFDALSLPDGRVALIVGDVVGDGVAASATMGQLRVLLHERLATDFAVPDALRALDAAAGRIRGARAATVGVVVLDPMTGAVEYCTAGHPPPLVVSADGRARYLPASGAGPIGVGGRFTAESIGRDELAAGDLVLLYTDGIMERPGRDLTQSAAELAQAAGGIVAGRAAQGGTDDPAERLCRQVLEILTRVTGHRDDITLLAGRLVPPPPGLAVQFPADETSLVDVRERVGAWLTDARVHTADGNRLLHAAVELATNALEHAYIDSADPHAYQVTADLADTGEVRIEVADRGRWREPAPSADRGLGLQLTAQMVDTLRVEHGDRGTTAAVCHRVGRPARLLTPGDLSPAPGERPADRAAPLLVLDQPSAPRPRIRVDGPVDAGTADEFERAILTAGSTGGRGLTVDLTGVTHLASAGVAALHRLAARHRDGRTALRLYAPAGTTAEMVLALVQLPHELDDPDYPEPGA